MNELVTRLIAEKSRNDAERANQIEEQRQGLLELESRRVEKLERMIQDWLKTMAVADYPHARLLTITSHKKVGGFFSTGIKPVEEQTVGWSIGSAHSSTHSGPYGDYSFSYSIELLVDGELIGNQSYCTKRRSDTLRGYRLGSGFEVKIPPDGEWVRTQLSLWNYAEDTIPETLKRIADEAGVQWDFKPSD